MENSRSNRRQRHCGTRAQTSNGANGFRRKAYLLGLLGMSWIQPGFAIDFYDAAAMVSDSNVSDPPTERGGLKIKLRVSARETYTDNVALAPADQKESDFVTEIAPGFRVTDKTARTDLDVDYSFNNLFYARDSDRNTINHQLQASGKIELVEDLFFLDSRAQISQQAVSVFGPIGADTNTSENNRTFRSYSLSPYLKKKLGREATIEARYTLSQVSSDAATTAVADSIGNRIYLGIDSGPAYRALGWGVNFVDERVNYENFEDTRFASLTGFGRYRLTKRLFATGSLGYDRNDYFTTGDQPEGVAFSMGIDWRPNQRTSLTASAGRRYFGSTYNLAFLNRTRRTGWDISYTQGIQTSRSQFIVPPGGLDRGQIEDSLRLTNPGLTDDELRQRTDDIITRFGTNVQTNVVFLEKKWRGLFTWKLAKSDLLLSAYNTVRDSEVTQSFSIFNNAGDFSLSRVIKQSGVGARWNYRLTARNQASIGLDLSRFRFLDIQRTDNTSSFNLGISRKLSREASGSLNYRYLQRDSNFGSGEYDENAIFGSITATF